VARSPTNRAISAAGEGVSMAFLWGPQPLFYSFVVFFLKNMIFFEIQWLAVI
jgi:hypothetical protein